MWGRKRKPELAPKPDYVRILDLEHELGIRKILTWHEYCREQMIARQANENSIATEE